VPNSSSTPTWKRLAEESLGYLQLQEALGRPPRLKEFGRIEDRLAGLAADVDQAWEKYVSVIEAAQREAPSTGQDRPRKPAEEATDKTLIPPEVARPRPPDQEREPPSAGRRSWFERLFHR
jgi:hypothetical protein